jgi:hypothetical protein
MVDYRIPFLAGAGMSLISLAAVQLIRTPPVIAAPHETSAVAKKLESAYKA